jgi:FkbM family methyltransferase
MTRIHYWYIRFIAQLIWWNERILFYPRLRQFYGKAFAASEKKPVILDIGANRGQSIRFFQQLFPACLIHAFEPNAKLFAQLSRHFSAPGVILHQAGMSAAPGELLFHENVLDETSSFESVQADSAYLKTKSRILLVEVNQLTTQSYPVKVTTIDQFLADTGITEADIVKVDVEGHEAAVLRGAAQALAARRIRFIQLEEHADDQYSHGPPNSEWLQANGYREVWRLKHGFGNFFEVVYERNDDPAMAEGFSRSAQIHAD